MEMDQDMGRSKDTFHVIGDIMSNPPNTVFFWKYILLHIMGSDHTSDRISSQIWLLSNTITQKGADLIWLLISSEFFHRLLALALASASSLELDLR